MGRKTQKTTWTNEMYDALWNCLETAVEHKIINSNVGIMTIVHSEWLKLFPNSKISKGALKIQVSRLQRERDPTSINNKTGRDDSNQVDDSLADKQQGNQLQQTTIASQNTTEVEQETETNTANTLNAIHAMNSNRDDLGAVPSTFNRADESKQHAKVTNKNIKTKKGKTHSRSRIDNDKRDYIITCYYHVKLNSKKPGKEAAYMRRVRQLWLQEYPDQSISISSIRNIICKEKAKQKQILRGAAEDTNEEQQHFAYNPELCNMPQDLGNLRRLRRSSERLACQPIFHYACYNCGRLITKDIKGNLIYKVDPESLDIQEPPVFQIIGDIGELAYVDSKGNWISCKNCKDGPTDLYDCGDPETGLQTIPDALKALRGPREKGQISIAGIYQKIVKNRDNLRKTWEHVQGQVSMMTKLNNHYYGMFGFLVGKTAADLSSQNQESTTDSELRIRRALFWLRENNHLYTRFYANYETLYRFDPERIIHLNDADRVSDSRDTSLAEHLHDEENGLVVNFNEPDDIQQLDQRNDHAGVQHPRSQDHSESMRDLKDLTKVSYSDPLLEAKLWPHLFPYATGCWDSKSPLKAGEYLKHRLLNIDDRWRKDTSFSFHWYDRLIKSRLFYIAQARRAKRIGRVEELVSKSIKDRGSDSFYERLGKIVPSTITGSRSYWLARFLDLIAMTKRLGQPDLFITLTQNDGWKEIRNHAKHGPGHFEEQGDINGLFEYDNVAPDKSFSIETVVAYNNRLKLFKEKVLHNKNGPLGEVLDFWDRKEFQSRGAIHNHMVVWCKPGTIPEDVVCAEMPRSDTADPTVTALRSYVQRLQMHKCRPSRCNRSSRGKKLNRCKYGFPFKIQMEDQLNPAGNRHLPKRRCSDDVNIVPYNKEILFLWGAHMNIQRVTSSGWELYLAKYVAKTEPSFQMQMSKDASDTERYIRTRIVGRLEVDHINLGHFLCQSSREVIYLPTDFNPEYGFVKRREHLPEDPDSTDVFYDNYLQKYMDRSSQLDHLLYPEWAANYTMARGVSAQAAENSDDSDENSNQSDQEDAILPRGVFTDLKGRKWKRRIRQAVPRWKFYLPNGDNQENYYMQKLILNCPLRRNQDIFSEENESKTYMEECTLRNLLSQEDDALNALHDAHQRGFSVPRLRRMAQQLVDANWIGEDEFNNFIDEVSTIQRSNMQNTEQLELEDVDIEHDEADLGALALGEREEIDINEYLSSFSQSQRAAFDHITGSLSSGKQVLTSIIGKAGTGKSYLLKAIVEYANVALHMSTKKLATTGVAAHLIDGETVHHFFKMDINSKSHIESGTTEYEIIRATDILVIDEFPLLDSEPFHKINELLKDMTQNKKEKMMPFGGKHVIMMGDPAQLPAIGTDIFGSSLWRRFNIVMLKEVKRQDNLHFQSLLSAVRMGLLTEEGNQILRQRLMKDIDIDNIDIDDAAIICSLRRERDSWNSLFLDTLDTPAVTFEALDTDANGKELSNPDKLRIKKYHRERMEDSLTLKVGARVVLTKNLDIEHGWINGTLGIVTNIHPNSITVENLRTKRKTAITKMKLSLGFPGTQVQFYRQQFPLILGWALTVHKVQGMTLDKAYIQLNKSFFASGQAYVALSRVKDINNLHLLAYDPKAIHLGDYYRELLTWMENNDTLLSDSEKDSSIPYPSRPETKKRDRGKKRKADTATGEKSRTKAKKGEQQRSRGKKGKHASHAKNTVSREPSHATEPTIAERVNTAIIVEPIESSQTPIPAYLLSGSLPVTLSSRKEELLAHSNAFEHIISMIQEREPLLLDRNRMQVDDHYQRELHPAMQTNLYPVDTLGDGNCLFYSIWKQFFNARDNGDLAKFIRLLVLYRFYEHEVMYRAYAEIDGFRSFEDYVKDCRRNYTFAGDLHIKAMADIFNRPIYSYRSFLVEGSTDRHIFANDNFHQLQQRFENIEDGTRNHHVMEPFSSQSHTNRKPIQVLYLNQNHYTALVNEREPQGYIVPTNDTYNLQQYAEEALLLTQVEE